MNQSEQINELAAALAKAQGQFKSVPLTAEVAIQTQKGGTYKYKYAPLDAIMDSVRKPLADNGLAVLQLPEYSESGRLLLITKIVHSSGQWVSGTLPLSESNDPKSMGSYITYMRRYALSSILGIVSTEDDDGTAATPQPQLAKGKAKPEVPRPQPAKSKEQPTNGHDKKPAPSNANDLLALVDSRVEATYNSTSHLLNAIRKQLGDRAWNFPKPENVEGWRQAYTAAMDYARTKMQSAEQEPLIGTEEATANNYTVEES